MRISRILSKLKNTVTKHKYITSAIALSAMVIIPVSAFAAWGPGRQVYDYSKAPLNGTDCTEADDTAFNRCGSLSGPVFNSFINTPSFGDERDFVGVSPAGQENYTNNAAVKPGDVISLRVYVHNNANQATNDSGKGMAHDTKTRIYLPSGTAQAFDVAGYVSASNAKQARVYDTARVSSAAGQKFSLSYVEGSAKLYNDGPFKNGVSLPDSVVAESGNGTAIGYNALDGKLPGCFEYRAVVIVKVKINAPSLQFSKQVTTPGSTDWNDSVSVKNGETVSWLLNYKNNGSSRITDVTLRDQIPEGLELVSNSITWFDQFHPNGETQKDTVLSSGGINIGDADPNGGGYIRFRTTVDADKDVCRIENEAFAKSNETPEQKDSALVNITDCKTTPPPTPTPSYSCDLLSATKIGENSENQTFKFETKTTAENAKVVDYTYDFGDDSDVLKTDKSTVEHTYAPGVYHATVKVGFDVDGEYKQVSSEECAVDISVAQPPTPETPTTPVPPAGPEVVITELPSTGAAGIISGTLGVSAISYGLYAWIESRKALRNIR